MSFLTTFTRGEGKALRTTLRAQGTPGQGGCKGVPATLVAQLCFRHAASTSQETRVSEPLGLGNMETRPTQSAPTAAGPP